MKKLEEQIAKIEFPITVENHQQLEVKKDGIIVDCYDPVYGIKIIEDKIIIDGFSHQKYEHELNEIDSLEVVYHE